MDLETNEQPVLTAALLGDATNFLVDGMVLALESYEGESISIELPTTVDLEVIKTDPGFAGDTATNATKAAIVSTGFQAQVPLFVSIGDKSRSTRAPTAYLTRVLSRRMTKDQRENSSLVVGRSSLVLRPFVFLRSNRSSWYNPHGRGK